MDKKSEDQTTSLANFLVDNIKNKDKCSCCGKSGNRSRWVSFAYCDHCLAKMIIEEEFQPRELRKDQDYVR